MAQDLLYFAGSILTIELNDFIKNLGSANALLELIEKFEYGIYSNSLEFIYTVR